MKIITCLIQDISRNIKESQKQTLVANERLQYLLSSTPAVIYAARTEGKYVATFISNNVTQVAGHRPADYI